MEDSLKGLLISLTIIGLFATSMLSFIVLYPQEQGVEFSDLQSADAYLTVNNSRDLQLDTRLSSINNQTESSFNEWDITQGYMGSNTIKQSSSSSMKTYNSNIFSMLSMIATKLFGANSPIVYAITVIFALSISVIVYFVIKFVRQGQ